jgi:hypothetical protein
MTIHTIAYNRSLHLVLYSKSLQGKSKQIRPLGLSRSNIHFLWTNYENSNNMRIFLRKDCRFNGSTPCCFPGTSQCACCYFCFSALCTYLSACFCCDRWVYLSSSMLSQRAAKFTINARDPRDASSLSSITHSAPLCGVRRIWGLRQRSAAAEIPWGTNSRWLQQFQPNWRM